MVKVLLTGWWNLLANDVDWYSRHRSNDVYDRWQRLHCCSYRRYPVGTWVSSIFARMYVPHLFTFLMNYQF